MCNMLPVRKLYVNTINAWADLARKYKFLPYPRLKYRHTNWLRDIYEILLERLVCPIKEHGWRFNSGNGSYCSRCKFYARTRDLKK